MNFFVWHGMVYATDGQKFYALDVAGFDDPVQWTWLALPEKLFNDIKQQYDADNYRGPG